MYPIPCTSRLLIIAAKPKICCAFSWIQFSGHAPSLRVARSGFEARGVSLLIGRSTLTMSAPHHRFRRQRVSIFAARDLSGLLEVPQRQSCPPSTVALPDCKRRRLPLDNDGTGPVHLFGYAHTFPILPFCNPGPDPYPDPLCRLLTRRRIATCR
jgi:hypothetical protein